MLSCVLKVDVRSGSSTDLTAPKFDFRSSPESGLKSDIGPCPFRANMRLMHRSKQPCYSITSSARVISIGDTLKPIALATVALMTNSYLVGNWTGSSDGLAPLRI